MPHIHSIVYQPKDKPYAKRFKDFIRDPLEEARLIADHGLEGDAKAGHNPKRQLNLLSLSWLEARKAEGFSTEPGHFGEQLILDGLDVDTLNSGDILQLGAEAQIEITQPRTGCSRLALAQDITEDDIKWHVGMLARVHKTGTIRVGDPVAVLTLVVKK